MTWQPEIDEIHQREALAHAMGGAEKVAKHHTQGRMTVRERIEICSTQERSMKRECWQEVPNIAREN